MPAARILVVEDRDALRRMMKRALASEGYEVAVAADAESGIRQLQEHPFDLVLTDLKLPGASGIDVLRAGLNCRPPVPVVVLTAYGTVGTAVEAMKLGAADFLEKPLEIEDLFSLVEELVDGQDRGELKIPDGPTLVGRDPSFRAAVKLLRRVAETDSTVLLSGESGTGKEVFARALHALSRRRSGPFIAVNCAALPEPLLENELFGHEKGAFTGAGRRHCGRFELAAGGTLLLDEVGELSLGVQAKVLRVLEERVFERVGGGASIHADVRLVAATNRSLAEMVQNGEFRSDLYYRLEVFPIELPALRDRSSDLAVLARHLIRRNAARLKMPSPDLTRAALDLLELQPWPGNVRQLSNVLERATILCQGPRLTAADIRSVLEPLAPMDEREEARSALVEARGDVRRAAAALGVSRRTLQRRIERHGLAGVGRYREW